ncbi:DNA-binding GntR family transcriptional regulator [Limimaricola variabilis]|jgi:DNA-binding GntR family transcriptional regulator|uniref:DNA-binding GntR family transcriptional regulator n=1 Tax=Limimaricola variabilis TaxID=1492771 RepID=A0ABR6HNS9_9RHOB|nr:GntR family transcriptional regulator [Limimaricola variabilis]MBB3712219.1 DNA-binding GntR family transcriptional regulator [Limimaricola variabilis]WPY95937.1 GntR family transcriptional regulator [Limimaricola variabilis]
MQDTRPAQKDAYGLILDSIDEGIYRPGDRLVESELADRFGVSRTPVREALQRLETQGMLTRDGRSLIVASLDHTQLAELYVVRGELEGLAARLAARHAAPEEVRVLRDMLEADQALVNDPDALARANRRFHKQIHLASHNRFLVRQLDLVHRSMALLASTSLAAEGRGRGALEEHAAIVAAIEAGDGDAADRALRDHISHAFVTRLKLDAAKVEAAR